MANDLFWALQGSRLLHNCEGEGPFVREEVVREEGSPL